MNPVGYFEIPVTDMNRAVRFYEQLFDHGVERTEIDGYAMALFPQGDGPGASGALACGDVYVPGKAGPVLYFTVGDLDAVLGRAGTLGAVLLYDKKDLCDAGWVAEIEDSEGNRIALHQSVQHLRAYQLISLNGQTSSSKGTWRRRNLAPAMTSGALIRSMRKWRKSPRA